MPRYKVKVVDENTDALEFVTFVETGVKEINALKEAVNKYGSPDASFELWAEEEDEQQSISLHELEEMVRGFCLPSYWARYLRSKPAYTANSTDSTVSVEPSEALANIQAEVAEMQQELLELKSVLKTIASKL